MCLQACGEAGAIDAADADCELRAAINPHLSSTEPRFAGLWEVIVHNYGNFSLNIAYM